MKNCPRCNAQMEDNAVFCQNCGFSVAQQAEPQAQQPQYNQYAAAPAPVVDQYDHTAEFSAEDVSENKLLAAVIYVQAYSVLLLHLLHRAQESLSILISISSRDLNHLLLMFFLGVIGVVLSWTCIFAIAAAVCEVIVLVCNYICLFKSLANKSIEIPVIRSLVSLNDLT